MATYYTRKEVQTASKTKTCYTCLRTIRKYSSAWVYYDNLRVVAWVCSVCEKNPESYELELLVEEMKKDDEKRGIEPEHHNPEPIDPVRLEQIGLTAWLKKQEPKEKEEESVTHEKWQESHDDMIKRIANRKREKDRYRKLTTSTKSKRY